MATPHATSATRRVHAVASHIRGIELAGGSPGGGRPPPPHASSAPAAARDLWLASLPTVAATVPLAETPAWAVLERQLMTAMERAVPGYVAKYTHPDGRLVFKPGLMGGQPDLELDPEGRHTAARDGLDDFYESFYNFPLLYMLGGSDQLLELGHRQFDATTRLGEELGYVHKEFEVGYDQFHQSESMIYFFLLCMADPTSPASADRARRFAGFFLNEDAEAINFDPEHKIIMSAHNGSRGARPCYKMIGGAASYGGPGFSSGSMARYGLPYEDVISPITGLLIRTVQELEEPANAAAMGEAMRDRMRMGDAATNLHVCTLLQNAFLMTSDSKYKDWLVDYVGAWMERAEAVPDGLLPDNVGLNGQVGEYMDGRFYGSMCE